MTERNDKREIHWPQSHVCVRMGISFTIFHVNNYWALRKQLSGERYASRNVSPRPRRLHGNLGNEATSRQVKKRTGDLRFCADLEKRGHSSSRQENAAQATGR